MDFQAPVVLASAPAPERKPFNYRNLIGVMVVFGFAALHYVLYGGFEGRDPSPMFSSQAYLDAYPDVRTVKMNPLVHYMQKGRYENRSISPSSTKPPAAAGKR